MLFSRNTNPDTGSFTGFGNDLRFLYFSCVQYLQISHEQNFLVQYFFSTHVKYFSHRMCKSWFCMSKSSVFRMCNVFKLKHKNLLHSGDILPQEAVTHTHYCSYACTFFSPKDATPITPLPSWDVSTRYEIFGSSVAHRNLTTGHRPKEAENIATLRYSIPSRK